MKVLMVTSQWPSDEYPHRVPFLVNEVDAIRKCGVDVDVFAFSGRGRPLNYLRDWLKLQHFLQEHTYDLIHAQFGQSGLITIFPKRTPLIVTFHGSDLNGIYTPSGNLTTRGYILRRASQVVASIADAVILVSASLAQFLPRKQKNYHVLPCGLDMDLFRPMSRQDAKEHLGLDKDKRYVLFSGGRTNPIKRFSLAKASISHLPTYLNAELLLTEGILPERMPLYLNASDLLLLTSSREGSPMIVKEALACNIPIVSVDVGDVRERIKGVDGCIICHDDNPVSISQSVRTVLERAPLINGRDVVKHLSLQNTAWKITMVYENTMTSVRSD